MEETATKPKAKAPRSKSRGPVPERLLKSRDKNGDGALTLREYTGKPVEEAPARTKIFKKLDTNSDGKLTLEELGKTGASKWPCDSLRSAS